MFHNNITLTSHIFIKLCVTIMNNNLISHIFAHNITILIKFHNNITLSHLCPHDIISLQMISHIFNNIATILNNK